MRGGLGRETSLMTFCRLILMIRRRFSIWRLSFQTFIGREIPTRVGGGEDLSLFCRKDDVNRSSRDSSGWYVKYQAFHPSRYKGRLETSVCRSTTLASTKLWQICTDHFDSHQPS